MLNDVVNHIRLNFGLTNDSLFTIASKSQHQATREGRHTCRIFRERKQMDSNP